MTDRNLGNEKGYIEVISKWVLTCFFTVCLWFGYEIDPGNHLAVSHIASLGLLLFALLLIFLRKTVVVRRPWGRRSELVIGFLLLLYVVIRLMQSVGNDFFWGQALKVILVVAVFGAYKIIDPRGNLLDYWAWLLPALLAAMIAVGLVIWFASGKIFEERFRVGANDYEYVSEYACHVLPLVMFSLERSRSQVRQVWIGVVGVLLLLGLAFTGSRAAMGGAVIAICTYAFLARHRLGKRLLVSGAFLVTVIAVGAIGNGIQRNEVGGSLLEDETAVNQLTSGRLTHWLFEIEQVTQDIPTIVFGTGLGRYAEWVPEAEGGGFYRTAVVNALLSAWIPFGLIGLFGYLFLYRYLWRRISAAADPSCRCMALSLFCAYVFTDQFETHWQGTKMLWYVSFILYLWTLSRPAIAAHTRSRWQLPLLNSYSVRTTLQH